MNYDKIKYTVFSVYEKCGIHRLPFDCILTINQMGYECRKYSDLTGSKLDACMALSNDACTIADVIYYNDKKSHRRVRFSLMHELGHLALETEEEAEANLFSSNILCPSMALHYSRLKNIREISNLFNISLECAKYARETYEKWIYSVKQYGMTDIDRKMYSYFYDEAAGQFVFKEEPCVYCGMIVYNSNKPICKGCDKPLSSSSVFDEERRDLLLAENDWLYGDLL
jgi:Predicted Zn peptidase